MGARVGRSALLLRALPAEPFTCSAGRQAAVNRQPTGRAGLALPLRAPSRAAGLARLAAFLPRAGHAYARERNHDNGPGHHNAVSGLSPWIRHRLITEAQVLAAVLAWHDREAAGKFIDEVCWRSYWKGWLQLRPRIWADYRDELHALAGRLPGEPALQARYCAAVEGTTGIDCFDAWLHELLGTGYLHNHARMWFASIWIHTLQLPWVLGADLFMRHLVDGDPASNTLSWRWVAGLHTRGKQYLATAENIARFSGGRFHPEGRLATRPLPVDAPVAPEPAPLPADAPLPAGRRLGLLLHEDDLHPESLFAEVLAFAAVVGLQCTGARSPLPVSDAVERFARGALVDGLHRAQACFGVTASPCAPQSAPEAIVKQARTAGLQALVTPRAPVGPVADTLDRLQGALAGEGIALVQITRDWDALAWPFATHGFFRFRRHIPALLALAQAGGG